jgi:hypothetical protein
MEIEVHGEIKAQPLDEEGDPVGEIVDLPPGKYELRGPVHENGKAWIVKAGTDELYEAQNLRPTIR